MCLTFFKFDNLPIFIVPPYGRRNVISELRPFVNLPPERLSSSPAVHGAVPREEGSRRTLQRFPPKEQKKQRTIVVFCFTAREQTLVDAVMK
jgi:hypothetical protein